MKTKLLVGVGLIVVAVAIYFLFGKKRVDTPATPAPPVATTKTEKPAAPAAPPTRGGDEAAPEPRLDVEDDPVGQLRLEGQVIDKDDKPVGGAVVRLSSHPPRTVKSEADGSFFFDKLVGRQFTVDARKEDAYGGPVTIRLTATKEPVILVLKPTGGLEITVVALDDKKPISGAEVEVGDDEGAGGTTGADGKVLLRGLSPGWQQIIARAHGFAPAQTIAEGGDRPGDVARQTIELKRGAAVSGKVVDAAGKPVAGARVRPAASSEIFNIAGGKKDAAVSDSAGAWSFPALPEGTFRFAAADDKHGPGVSAPVTLDGKTERKDIQIKLEDGARIAGKVVRKDGTPVAAATVRVVSTQAGWGDDATRQAFSDDRGAFDISGLPRRKVEVVAFEEQASSQTVALDLEAKPEQSDVTITLDVEGMIAGTVVDAKNQPAPDVQVAAVPELGLRSDPTRWRLRGMARDTTDSAGKFELRGLADGTYRLRAGRSGGMLGLLQRTNVSAKTGDTDVRIVLEDDGKVKGKVLYSDGSAPDSFSVATGYGRGTPFVAGDGAFEIDVPAGPTTLSISGPSFVQKTVSDVQVKGGETSDVGTINVERGRSLSGRVIGVSGAPLAGAKVMAGPQLMGSGSEMSSGGLFGGGPGVKSTTSGDDGGYVLSGVGPRSLVLVAEAPEGRSNMVRVPAGAGSGLIDLYLRAYGSLEGQITAAGKPVGPGMVIAQPQQASRGNFIVQSGEDGKYRYDKLAPDTYRVSAMRQGGMMRGSLQAKVVTIEPEKTAQLDIELPGSGVNVTLTVSAPPGTTVTTAQVLLVQGNFTASNADQFNERIGELGAGALHQGFILKGEPVKVENVEPGSYSACGIPIPGDINSPRDMVKIRDQMDKLLVACQPATVTKEPAEQSIAIKVPAPPPI